MSSAVLHHPAITPESGRIERAVDYVGDVLIRLGFEALLALLTLWFGFLFTDGRARPLAPFVCMADRLSGPAWSLSLCFIGAAGFAMVVCSIPFPKLRWLAGLRLFVNGVEGALYFFVAFLIVQCGLTYGLALPFTVAGTVLGLLACLRIGNDLAPDETSHVSNKTP